MSIAPVTRVLRGPGVSRVLTRLGIEPRKFWLLTDLFGALSERGEIMDQLGRNGVTLKSAGWLYLVLSVVVGLAMVAMRVNASAYLGTFIGITAFLLISVLLSETGNSLVNPMEGLILAHQPINGATYTAAKLTHLALIVLYLVPALNGVPALLGIFLKDAAWFYPLLHLFLALMIGVVCALLCCALYGWLIRFIPANRLKAAGQLAGVLPFLVMMWGGQLMRLMEKARLPQWIVISDTVRLVASAVLGVLCCVVVVLGLRSLSADYLIRVSSLTRGGSSAAASTGRSMVGGIVERFFGGQAGRAGFSFVARMMLRDWQFRRQMIPMVLPMFVSLAPVVTKGWQISPFQGPFTWIHVVPHVFGIGMFFVCSLLHWGTDYKGAWIFHLAPSRAFFQFARGVHGLLWLESLFFPHLILFLLLVWPWGWLQAGLFTLYSIAVASVYLGLELRMIDGIPFSRQLETAAGAMMFPVMMLGGIATTAIVGLQHFVLFRSMEAVIAATCVAGIAAFYVTRSSLRSFELTMRHNLAMESVASGSLYKEVNA